MSDFTSEHDNSLKRLRWQVQTFQLYLHRRLNSRNILKLFISAIFILVILFFNMTSDNVPRDHLDLSQSWFDRLEVLSGRWAESPSIWSSPPYCSEEDKAKQSTWENFEEGKSSSSGDIPPTATCPVIDEPFLVWVLKTPKSASSTLQDLIIALRDIHPERYAVNSRQIRINRAMDRTLVVERYKEYFKGLNRRTVFTAHGWFLNLENNHRNHDNPLPIPLTHAGVLSIRPVYIGTLRDPLKRLISHYEYLHEGPRSMASIERHGQVHEGIPDFATCVAQYIHSVAAGESDDKADKWNCMHWANIQLKYFCGYDDYEVCAAAGEKAFEIAMYNIHRYFLVVGLVERFEDMLLVLEKELPIFKGISELYTERGSSRVNTKSSFKSNSKRRLTPSPLLRSSINKQQPMINHRGQLLIDLASSQTQRYRRRTLTNSSSSALPDEVSDFLTKRLRYEQKLYDYAVVRFDRQMKTCFGS